MHSSSGIVIFSLSEADAIKNGLPFGKPFLIAEETLFPSLLHDVFVFIVQMIDDDIEDDTDDFCVKALVRAWEARIKENAAVFCSYILEDLVAAIQLVQVFEEGELIFIFQELASDLDADDGVDGIVCDDAERNGLSFDLQVRLEYNGICVIFHFIFDEKVHFVCLGVGFEFLGFQVYSFFFCHDA